MTAPPVTPDEHHAPAPARGATRGVGGLVSRTRAGIRAFPRQFWLLALGFFGLLVGIDMCFPFETTYLHDRLGYSMTSIGLLLGLPLLVAIPFYVVDGAIADRYGRKPSIVAGICFTIVLYVTFAFARELWQIAIAVTAEAAFGWALFLTGSNAMIADLVPFGRRAEAYSITRVAFHGGMVVGPLVAAVILARDPTYRYLFLTGATICLGFILDRPRVLPRDSAGRHARGEVHEGDSRRLRRRAARSSLSRLLRDRRSCRSTASGRSGRSSP